MTSDLRAERRRQWRADRKNLRVKIPYQEWTPTYFDEVKRKIREYKERQGA